MIKHTLQWVKHKSGGKSRNNHKAKGEKIMNDLANTIIIVKWMVGEDKNKKSC